MKTEEAGEKRSGGGSTRVGYSETVSSRGLMVAEAPH